MDKDKISAAFISLMLVTTLITLLLPEATATPTPTTITTITPKSGPVGRTVRVIGNIITTNGTYQILWDEKRVKTGTAMERTVNDTFAVPSSVEGDHNVTLYDITNATESQPETFTVTTSCQVSAEPRRIQEGLNTNITMEINGAEAKQNYTLTINVTNPQNQTCTTTLIVSTNTTGSGFNSTLYYENFASAHTNYVGTYPITVIDVNKTLTTGNFTVGLTNATKYHRFQVVGIRAAGYQANESVWVNITFAGEDVTSIQKNASIGGVIEAIWQIPATASMGLYTVNITSSKTNGTTKLVPDTQNFMIAKIPCQIQTKKLDGEVLAGVEVWVYNATMGTVNSSLTDEEGWAKFWLEGGNFTFEAEWGEPGRRIPVGILVNESIREKVTLTLWCWIAHLKMAISPPLPFINITLTYRYKSKKMTSSFETNSTGIAKAHYVPTNASYTIVARRYGLPLPFYNETFPKLPAKMNASWIDLNMTCPTYTASVHVLDSKGEDLPNVQVSLAEWISWVPVDWGTTDDQGNVNLSALFGRYKVKVYNYSAVLDRKVVLNETVIDLIENRSLLIHCMIFNVDLSVKAIDYFGQPIPNAMVEVELKVGPDWVKIDSSSTGSDGFARFTPLSSIVGGDCRVSVYVAGERCGIKHLYLYGSRQILFKVGKYVVVWGYPVETSQLIVCISIVLLAAVFGLALTYRKLLRRFVKNKAAS